jgi:Cytochrome C oxidase, cbb3-type, subunit III
MRYVCLLALILMISTATVLSAQGGTANGDGAAIYKERCASCHDMPQGRVPALAEIKAMSGESIYVALTTGPMKFSSCWGTSVHRAGLPTLHCSREPARSTPYPQLRTSTPV